MILNYVLTGLSRQDGQKRSAASRPDSVRALGSARCAMSRMDLAKTLKTTILIPTHSQGPESDTKNAQRDLLFQATMILCN